MRLSILCVYNSVTPLYDFALIDNVFSDINALPGKYGKSWSPVLGFNVLNSPTPKFDYSFISNHIPLNGNIL